MAPVCYFTPIFYGAALDTGAGWLV